MSAGTPFFSVVIPLYNKRLYIRRAVESVLAQSVGEFELLVIDDGSTDDSVTELSGTADQRLRIIAQENQGEGAARNRGLSESRGAWIALLDADDMWLDHHLAELRRVIDASPLAGLAATASAEVLPGGVPPSADHKPRTISDIDYFAEAARRIGVLNSSCVAVSREAVLKTGGFGPFKAGADLEYWARIAVAFPVARSSKVTAIYFRGTGGAMEQIAAGPVRSVEPVMTLADVSPSVAFLCCRAENHPDQWRNDSLRRYANSRIVSGIRAALHSGDVNQARCFARLLIKPTSAMERAIAVVVNLPDAAITLLVALYRATKT